MKPIRGVLRGVKQDPKPSKAEQLESLDKELKNLQMAGRVTQMMVQKMMQNMQTLGQDLGKAFATINELQYKLLAMQSVGNFDMKAMQVKAEELRLNDFIEASDAEDKQGNFTIGDKVQENSTVIITSTTSDDTGIFRSRIKLSECGVPALIQGLMDQSIGTKVTCKLNDIDHVVELLGIRNPPAATQVVPTGDVVVNTDGSEQQDYVRVPANTTVH